MYAVNKAPASLRLQMIFLAELFYIVLTLLNCRISRLLYESLRIIMKHNHGVYKSAMCFNFPKPSTQLRVKCKVGKLRISPCILKFVFWLYT